MGKLFGASDFILAKQEMKRLLKYFVFMILFVTVITGCEKDGDCQLAEHCNSETGGCEVSSGLGEEVVNSSFSSIFKPQEERRERWKCVSMMDNVLLASDV